MAERLKNHFSSHLLQEVIILNKGNIKVPLILINSLGFQCLLDLIRVESQGKDILAENFSVVINSSHIFNSSNMEVCVCLHTYSICF